MEKLIRNRNDMLTAIFLSVGIVVVVGGGAILYSVMNPSEPVELSRLIVGSFCGFLLFCGLGVMFHGFNPLLLVKR